MRKSSNIPGQRIRGLTVDGYKSVISQSSVGSNRMPNGMAKNSDGAHLPDIKKVDASDANSPNLNQNRNPEQPYACKSNCYPFSLLIYTC